MTARTVESALVGSCDVCEVDRGGREGPMASRSRIVASRPAALGTVDPTSQRPSHSSRGPSLACPNHSSTPEIPVPTQREAHGASTHIFASLEALPPVTFWTRSETSSVLSSSSCLRSSSRFLLWSSEARTLRDDDMLLDEGAGVFEGEEAASGRATSSGGLGRVAAWSRTVARRVKRSHSASTGESSGVSGGRCEVCEGGGERASRGGSWTGAGQRGLHGAVSVSATAVRTLVGTR